MKRQYFAPELFIKICTVKNITCSFVNIEGTLNEYENLEDDGDGLD